jgi:hypothetical protein
LESATLPQDSGTFFPLLVLTLLISGGARVSLATSFTFTNFDDPLGTFGTNAFGINASGQIAGNYADGSGFMVFCGAPMAALSPTSTTPQAS